MKGTFLFLGTGASAGVPLIGCKCAVCASSSPKNKRFRPSGLLRAGGKALLIDIGPDFRSQALQFQIEHLDGLLLTHTHYDHIAGIDEIRLFNVRQQRSFPCLLSAESFREIEKRYSYFFDEKGRCAKLAFSVLDGDRGETEFLGLPIGYCSFSQGGMKVTGFRLGEFAYICDIQKYDDSLFEALVGVKTLVLSALRPEPSPCHLSFEQVAQIVERVQPAATWITHLGHFFDHEALNARLPQGVQVAYDGLTVEFACTP